MSDNFKWTNELVAEYGQFYHSCFNDPEKYLGKDCLKAFIKQKEAENNYHKEYEILSIVAGGVVREYTGSEHQNKLLDFGYPINSIKRLSDGEIFIIGDTLDEMEIGEKVITGFYANYKGNTLWVSTNNERGYGCSLGVAKKKRSFRYTTYDGIDVFEFDTFPVYKVTNSEFYLLQFAACDANPIPNNDKYFADKKVAEDYIIQNKPVTITYNQLYIAIENRPLASIKDFFKSKIFK